MAECCGNKDVETPFCPVCGKELTGAAKKLLRHLQTYATIYRAAADRAFRKALAVAEDPERPEEHFAQYERSATKRSNTAAKWESWADALAELMQEGGG